MSWFANDKEKDEELKKREASLKEFEQTLEQWKMKQDNRDSELLKREAAIIRSESEAQIRNAGLLDRELGETKQRLQSWEKELSEQSREIEKSKEDMRQREARIREAEILRDQGFTDERKKQDDVLSKKQKEFEEVNERLRAGRLAEIENRESVLVEREAQLLARGNQLSDKVRELEKSKEEIRQREERLREAEILREEGFTGERKKLDDEFIKKQREFEDEIALLRIKRFAELEENIAMERLTRLKALDRELSAKRNSFEEEKRSVEAEAAQTKKELTELRAELGSKSEDLEEKEQRLQARLKNLEEREEYIEEEVGHRTEERRKSFDREESRLRDECERLRGSLERSSDMIGMFEELKRKLGNEEPESVLFKLNSQEETLKKLRQELQERPTREMQMDFDESRAEVTLLKQRNEGLSMENEDMKRSMVEQSRLELQIDQLDLEKKSLADRNVSLETQCNSLRDDLRRYVTAYEKKEERENRILDIEVPLIKGEPKEATGEIEEEEWLENIRKSCIKYGLRFPRRILHAFHTSLKTSEWSPLTVLAGVSGTGKSELPRLYSHFGGLNFLSLSVQPNWDSQESMLGFFNSIDNKFDAQPVLRLLAQTQKRSNKEYPEGLKDFMTLILMDEMNLAHVELYFAEFLSKLELRRGMKGDNVPLIEVKLGAGIRPYELMLYRNILWAGTMNQDETTKSLSDKVLDRGILINFPRPTKMERRKVLNALGEAAPLIPRSTWDSWWSKGSIFTDDQIHPYKTFIEEMNGYLARAGRALGHRVWQSIEYYMSNYPDVRLAQNKSDDAGLDRAMNIAFEDQLVQKVMPKLRGIETRGNSRRDCLDKIKTQLSDRDYSIVEDFVQACECGHGLFMWNSANYLKDDADVTAEAAETTANV